MKLGVNVPDELLQDVVACKPGVIEYILNHLKSKVVRKFWRALLYSYSWDYYTLI